jgi:hypothetical protein
MNTETAATSSSLAAKSRVARLCDACDKEAER